MSTAATNSWLKAQRKSDLVELADNVGLKKWVLFFLFCPRNVVLLGGGG